MAEADVGQRGEPPIGAAALPARSSSSERILVERVLDSALVKFIRYLACKKRVDDRALNAHVAGSFLDALPACSPAAPVRLLEVGAGIGTMIERLLEWDAFSHAVITAVDEQPELLREARRRLTYFGRAHGFAVSDEEPSALELSRDGHAIRIEFVASEVIQFARTLDEGTKWDALLAHAFLDLVDLNAALAALIRLLHDGSLLYLTINFDGTTQFLPGIDPTLDAEIEARYHETMDRRRRDGLLSGDSHTGRRLFQALPAVGAEILDSGSSDWVVFPVNADYTSDERFFLNWIIDAHESALQGHDRLEPARLANWIARRRRQLERGELTYITHQLDFLAQRASSRTPTGA